MLQEHKLESRLVMGYSTFKYNIWDAIASEKVIATDLRLGDIVMSPPKAAAQILLSLGKLSYDNNGHNLIIHTLVEDSYVQPSDMISVIRRDLVDQAVISEIFKDYEEFLEQQEKDRLAAKRGERRRAQAFVRDVLREFDLSPEDLLQLLDEDLEDDDS